MNGDRHGPDAAALPIPPADYRQHLPYHADKFFFQVMTNGIGTVMPAFGQQLTEDEDGTC